MSLRERAQNEQTSIALNNLLKLKEQECADLRAKLAAARGGVIAAIRHPHEDMVECANYWKARATQAEKRIEEAEKQNERLLKQIQSTNYQEIPVSTDELFSPESMRYFFAYDPDTGHVTRNHTKTKYAAGSRVGTPWKSGYRYIRHKGKVILEHRLCWLLHYGSWPSKFIDHINCDKSDNRICNLREATITENNWNRGVQKNNTTGYKGVSFSKLTGKYVARIKSNGVDHHLGQFDTAIEASNAYANASKELHNEFART